jgi:hypothetical protein
MKTVRNATLDLVLLAMLGPSVVVVLMACLWGLVGLSRDWNGDVLGQLLLFRSGIAQGLSNESRPSAGELAKPKLNTGNAPFRNGLNHSAFHFNQGLNLVGDCRLV